MGRKLSKEGLIRRIRDRRNDAERQGIEHLLEEMCGTTSAAAPDSGKWEAVVRVLKTHYHEPDIEAARVLYAAVAAHYLPGPPVWPMAVAPPSSMKSELLSALEGLPHVYAIDSVTPKTFISGQIRNDGVPKQDDRASSLLHRIGDSGIMLCSDFSTVLSIKSDDRNVIFADLRRIYDGALRKEFGTSEAVAEWRGRLTFVAAVTPDIEKHYAALQAALRRFEYSDLR
jgi:hypothetical protein